MQNIFAPDIGVKTQTPWQADTALAMAFGLFMQECLAVEGDL
jgi:hypothetical protein